MECRERYFMIGVDLSFTGKELRFEAVGKFPLKASLLHWSIFFFLSLRSFFRLIILATTELHD